MKKLGEMSTFYKNMKDGCSRSDEKVSKNEYFLQKHKVGEAIWGTTPTQRVQVGGANWRVSGR